MPYYQHFHKGQKVILKPDDSGATVEQKREPLFAVVTACTDTTLELSFAETFNFDPDHLFASNQPFRILSESQGKGIRVQAIFKEHSNNNTIRLDLEGDLNHFNRRCNHRVKLELVVGLEESPVSRRIVEERWEHQIKQFKRNKTRPNTAQFAEREISLSSSGLGVSYPTPVQPGHYFMIYLDFNDNSDLICSVGEVVRCEPDENNSFYVGLSFDLIEADAQQKIDQFVNQQAR